MYSLEVKIGVCLGAARGLSQLKIYVCLNSPTVYAQHISWKACFYNYLKEGSYADWLFSTIASKLMDYYNY